MPEHSTLSQYLDEWAGDDALRMAVSQSTQAIADACCAISEIIALGPLAGNLAAGRGQNRDRLFSENTCVITNDCDVYFRKNKYL